MPIKGSCHCGNTQFEVNEAPTDVTRCTCSLCSKRGALWAYYTPAQFRLTSAPENVATYLWGSRTVKHHFCANCGRPATATPGRLMPLLLLTLPPSVTSQTTSLPSTDATRRPSISATRMT